MPPTMRFTSEMWHPNSKTLAPPHTHSTPRLSFSRLNVRNVLLTPSLSLSRPHIVFRSFTQVYKDGRVCISILHAPGSDPNQYENASERWLPVHTVESILVSVISMLASPNDESPANLDAAKEWRETPDVFKKKVRETVRRAQEDW